MASDAFVRVRRVAYVRYATSAMRSQTWTVSVMGRSAVRTLPDPERVATAPVGVIRSGTDPAVEDAVGPRYSASLPDGSSEASPASRHADRLHPRVVVPCPLALVQPHICDLNTATSGNASAGP